MNRAGTRFSLEALVFGVCAALAALFFYLAAIPALDRQLHNARTEVCRESWSTARPLAPGDSVEGRLEGSRSHSFLLRAAPGHLVEITARQQGADLALRLLSPTCGVLDEADTVIPLNWAEKLEAEVGRSGVALLEVQQVSDSPAGGFAIDVSPSRPPVAADRERRQARRQSQLALSRLEDPASRACDPNTLEQKVGVAEELVGQTLSDRDLAARASLALAKVQRACGGVDAAKTSLARALEIWRGWQNPLGEAWALRELGTLQAEEEDLAAAVRSLTLAGERSRQALDPREEAQSIGDLGLVLRWQGDLEGAAALYRSALDWGRRSGQPALACRLANSLGVVEQSLGRIAEARDLYQESAAACRLVGQGLDAVRALAMGSMAELALENFDAARNLLQEASDLAERVPDPAAGSLVAFYRGELALQSYDLESAKREFSTAWASFMQLDPHSRRVDLPTIEAALRLGWIDSLDRGTAAALNRFQEAKQRARRGDNRLASLVYQALGVAQREAGELAQAERSLSEALSLSEKGGFTNLLGTAKSELGETYRRLGSLEAAEEQLRSAKAAHRAARDTISEAVAGARLALVDRDRKDLAGAREEMEWALGAFESARSQLVDPHSRTTFFSLRRQFYDEYIDLLMALATKREEPKLGEQAFNAAERSRARGLLDLLAESRVDVRADLPSELEQREATIDRELSRIGREMVALRNRPRLDEARFELLERDLERLEADRRRLELEIRHASSRYAAVRYPEPLRLPEVQRLLGKRNGAVLLQYSLGEARSFLFVVSPKQFKAIELPGSHSLATLGNEWTQLVGAESGSSSPRFAELGEQLFELLVLPAWPEIEGVEELIIAPDDFLYLLPFEALVVSPGIGRSSKTEPAFLVEEFPISYVPSATVLASLQSQEGPERGQRGYDLVAIGNPDYRSPEADMRQEFVAATLRGPLDRKGRFFLPRLLGSEQEVRGIAGLFEEKGLRAELLLGKAANEHLVKSPDLLPHARHVHFAVHAFSDDRDAERYGLILSLDDPGGEDGVLQLAEIFRLKLQAELVVLSACSSGLGQRVRGEGLVGLARAFFYAGTPSLVVSLWQVDDQETAKLMQLFYRQLLAGSTKAEALRSAKLAMLAENRSISARFWAPFILVGDSR